MTQIKAPIMRGNYYTPYTPGAGIVFEDKQPQLTRALLARSVSPDIARAYLELARRVGEAEAVRVMREELGE